MKAKRVCSVVSPRDWSAASISSTDFTVWFLTIRSTPSNGNSTSALEKMTIWACDLIIAVGRDTIRHYHRENIGRSIPHHVVYSGIDVAEFERRLNNVKKDAFRREIGIPDNVPVLVNIGRFSPAKAQSYTIKAFARLQCPEARLLLVGEGPERAACERLCAELGVEDRVIFAGIFPGYYTCVCDCLCACPILFARGLVRRCCRSIPRAGAHNIVRSRRHTRDCKHMGTRVLSYHKAISKQW